MRRSTVLLIEGGGTNIEQEKISDPRVYTRNFGTDTDWGYKSTPQAHLNNRVIVAPVGKIIGGGSSINATVWLKGDKADYDTWEDAAGPGWGFDASSAISRRPSVTPAAKARSAAAPA